MAFSRICRMTYPANVVNMVGKTSDNAVQSSRHTHSIAILYSNSNVTAVKDKAHMDAQSPPFFPRKVRISVSTVKNKLTAPQISHIRSQAPPLPE